MRPSFHRFIAIFATVSLMAGVSLAAESRSQKRTDLRELAAELERVLGPGRVAVSDQSRPPRAIPQRPSQLDQQAIVAAMNRERGARGLAPLRLDSSLSAAAEDRVTDMLRKGYFDHVAPDGTQPFVWLGRNGYRYRTAAENLATGLGSPVALVDGWMRSPGHRANILGRSFEDVGVAVATASPSRNYSGPLVVAIYASR